MAKVKFQPQGDRVFIEASPAEEKTAGGIIILELNTNDYSLVQIAQIVESNDAKILSSYITSNIDSTKIELTIKINTEDLSGILQTFFRYNYNVKASFHLGDYTRDLKNRFEEFIHYLNI